MEKNYKLNDDVRAELASAAVLYMLIERKVEIDKDLSGANRALAAIIKSKEKVLWELEKKIYLPTRKGELFWENWKARWWDFKLNFEIFAGVDLADGQFADEEADLEAKDENGNFIWEDLRVAVTLRKIGLAKKSGHKTALDPGSVTFLALLSEGRLDQSSEWQFDIAFDSIFWSEIENIVNSNLWGEELGYDDVPWGEVIDDIIKMGTEESKERFDDEDEYEGYYPSRGFQTKEEVVEEYTDELADYGYDPGYYTYNPYWGVADAALTVGAIGMCWALLY